MKRQHTSLRTDTDIYDLHSTMETPNSLTILFSRSTCIFIAMMCLLSHGTQGETVALDGNNFNNIIATHELVFVNFYADWCRFSQILAPVFADAAKKVKEVYPEVGKVAFGKVDCGVATTYHISKYPTLKLFRNGQDKKRNMIGYFSDKETDSYKTFRRVAMQLREDCVFHAVIGAPSEGERGGSEAKLVFRPPNTRREDIQYVGETHNFDFMVQWMQERCVPLVPSMNFLTADGSKFSHPLHHLGKTANDLPVLAIDSFRHMYLFPHDIHEGLETQGLLKQFVSDLHSGKLHREFHHGPDPTKVPALPNKEETGTQDGSNDQANQPESPNYPTPTKVAPTEVGATDHLPKETAKPSTKTVEEQTSPPESVFKNLKPSENRYSFADPPKDEL
ncbi:ERP44-like protein [Mya arenaria]|uniref:ERP44-like protein n=1 Tax=Mya arenaria TaxID=6604 RepID=A0ABY7EKP4_MYAAR|nr:ERP44-like protein [Mya arenaria]